MEQDPTDPQMTSENPEPNSSEAQQMTLVNPEKVSSEVIMSCAIKENTKPDVDNCKSNKLVVRRGKRIITLTKENPEAILEVVGGQMQTLQEFFGVLTDFKAAIIECSASFAAGPCDDKGRGSHKGKTFDISPHPAMLSTSDTLKFEAFSEWVLFPWQATPFPYDIHFNTCSENLVAKIKVFPDIEFGMGIEFKYQKQTSAEYQEQSVSNIKDDGFTISRVSRTKSKNLRNQTATYTQETAKVIRISESLSVVGFYKFSGIEIELRAVLKKYTERVKTIEELVRPLIGLVNDIRAKANEAKSNNEDQLREYESQVKSPNVMTFPNVSVRFSGLWHELDDSYECHYMTKVALVFKPLFGMEFRYDITDAVLRATGVGNTIAQVKSYLKGKNIEAFALVISTGFSVNLEVAFEWARHQDTVISGSVDVTFPVKLEATALKMTKESLTFGYHSTIFFDLGIRGESGVKVVVKAKSIGLDFAIDWTGIKVTLMSKYNVCVSRVKNECAPPGASTNAPAKFPKNKKGQDNSFEKSFVIPGRHIYEKKQFIEFS